MKTADMASQKNKREAGNVAIEFALCAALLVPLMLGTVTVGLNLSRSIQTSLISRDAGHMFARQVDFSQTGNQDIIVRLATGLNMTRTSGNGVVILSKVTFIGASQCTGAGLSLSQCTNYNRPVITQRLVIGNASLRSSTIGSPDSSIIGSDGKIAANDYLVNATARATGIEGVLTMQPAELAYVSESYFSSPDFDFGSRWVGTGSYARTIF